MIHTGGWAVHLICVMKRLTFSSFPARGALAGHQKLCDLTMRRHLVSFSPLDWCYSVSEFWLKNSWVLTLCAQPTTRYHSDWHFKLAELWNRKFNFSVISRVPFRWNEKYSQNFTVQRENEHEGKKAGSTANERGEERKSRGCWCSHRLPQRMPQQKPMQNENNKYDGKERSREWDGDRTQNRMTNEMREKGHNTRFNTIIFIVWSRFVVPKLRFMRSYPHPWHRIVFAGLVNLFQFLFTFSFAPSILQFHCTYFYFVYLFSRELATWWRFVVFSH